MAATFDAALAQEILRHLHVGVVVCVVETGEIVLVNDAGRQALRELGGAEDGRVRRDWVACVLRTAPTESACGALVGMTLVAKKIGRRYRVAGARLSPPRYAMLSFELQESDDPRLRKALLRSFGVSGVDAAIVTRVCRGLRNKEIAQDLDLTEGTVRQYLVRIYATLGVSNRTQLTVLLGSHVEKRRR